MFVNLVLGDNLMPGNTDEKPRYKSWVGAVHGEGVIYMVWERLFWLLSFVSPASWRFRIARRAHKRAVPKLQPVAKDIWKLAFFMLAGTALPVYLVTVTGHEHSLSFRFLGGWIVLLVLQHHINTAVFDPFRGNFLPVPEKEWRWCKALDASIGRLLPLDMRKENLDVLMKQQQGYVLTSIPRRIVLAVMDFWLLLVGFALLHWLVPPENSFVINSAVQKSISFDTALYFSVVTATTLGYGDIFPYNSVSRSIAMTEVLSSFFFAGTFLAYAAGLLPRPRELFAGNNEATKDTPDTKETNQDGVAGTNQESSKESTPP